MRLAKKQSEYMVSLSPSQCLTVSVSVRLSSIRSFIFTWNEQQCQHQQQEHSIEQFYPTDHSTLTSPLPVTTPPSLSHLLLHFSIRIAHLPISLAITGSHRWFYVLLSPRMAVSRRSACLPNS